MAYSYYKAFRILSPFVILIAIIVQYLLRDSLVNFFTDIKSARTEALKAIWLFSFNMLPTLFKGMLKGIIKALGI
jgi:uncharacterized membrane protein